MGREDGAEAAPRRKEGTDVLQGLIRTFTGGDGRDPVRVLQDVAAAFGVPNGSVIMDFVEGFLADLAASVRNGLQAAAAQLRSESRTEALAPSVEVVDELIAKAMPEIVVRVREAMRAHMSFVEENKTQNATEAAAASAAQAAATDVVPAAAAASGAPAAGDTAQLATKSAKPSLPPKKKAAPGGLGLGGGLKKKPATAKTGAAGALGALGASGASGAPSAVSAGSNPMQQMMGMLGGAGGAGAGSNPLSGLLGGLMGGRPQQPEAPLDVDEVLTTEIQVPEERMMWKSTVDQMEAMAAARGSNGAPELPPLGDAYLAAIPSSKSGGSALDQIFDI